jgi:hypothetical protein
MRWLLIGVVMAAGSPAQPLQTAATNASVSGIVKDAITGKPLAGYNVSTFVNANWVGDTIYQSRDTKQVHSVTDEQGRYKIGDLPPGPYRLNAVNAESFGGGGTRHVEISGHDLDGIDFRVKVTGSISGRVLDDNKEPVPGITVYLVSREYYGGVLGHFIKEQARTDDRGEYALKRVQAGHPYLLMAQKVDRTIPPHSETPLDPKLRRRVAMRTFYPNSAGMEGAAAISIRPGEIRERVDIEMKRAQNYCIDGTMQGAMGPGELNFSIEVTQPSYGASSTGGMFGIGTTGMTGPDGKFRICDLSPGNYRLTAWDRGSGGGAFQQEQNRALMPFTIGDQDLHNTIVAVSPGPTLNGEVVWDGSEPVKEVTTKVNIHLTPLLRAGLNGERPSARADIPGPFSLTGLAIGGDYAVFAGVNASGMYVKDVTYMGRGLLHAPLHLTGAGEGAGLHVVMARDGGYIQAQVSNKEGTPVADIQVLFLSAGLNTPAELQSGLAHCQTNQMGTCSSVVLAPGKYYVGAAEEMPEATPEGMEKLWRDRTSFQEVVLSPKGSLQVRLDW